MADMTPTPWPGPGAANQTDRFWPDGSFAAWAFDDGSWVIFRPGFKPGDRKHEFECGDVNPDSPTTGKHILLAARAAADEALSRLLAEMAAEVTRG